LTDPRLKKVRAACEARLRELQIPDPFEVGAFCQSVATRRGRRLHLLPLPLPPSDQSPFGVWAATDTEDFILHDPTASPLHRDLIILHEVAHMLFGHRSETAMDAVSLLQALPGLDPEMVRRVLSRHLYSTEEEQQAEMLASLILERATSHPAGVGDDLLGRLGDALVHPVRRRRQPWQKP
jgi:hypothetical protein